jgi:hypothetical protein
MKRPILVLALLIAACSQDEPPPPEPKAPEGRAETRAIRNTEAVGTGGAGMANKIDNSLNAQDEAERKRKEAAEQQSSESP